ncbi:alpha-L-fucosidase [Ilumatobacter sp.]|uniref:alpha-L-fucosidase n=1 Tax=Ilumatobacter sp. TaxID=1967498 RepID=UPI003B51FA95
MTMPAWWDERPFGILVHANVASVPAFAPIGADAGRYLLHLGGDPVADGAADEGRGRRAPRPVEAPMVEVLAHHRDRWGHIDEYEDFVPLLTFEHFDAESWARLAHDAGAGYAIQIARDHDGWAWWDATQAPRRLTERGPRRDVLAEFAAACERSDIVFGTQYSLATVPPDAEPDPGARVGDPIGDAAEVVRAQVVDLVGRLGSAYLRGDRDLVGDAGHWRTAELMRAVRDLDPAVVIDDRWWASRADLRDDSPDIVASYEHEPPAEVTAGPWELVRGIGPSLGLNRAELAEHQLTGRGVVDLLTEVVAKGGHLLLAVGADADGSIPDSHSAPLRAAGTWIRRHAATLAAARPWSTWGDAEVRYLADGESVLVVDVAGRGRFPALDPVRWRVVDVRRSPTHDAPTDGGGASDGDPVRWDQDGDGLHVVSSNARGDADPIGIEVLRVEVVAAERAVGLFDAADVGPRPLAPLLAGAVAGDIVQLGDGTYVGPAAVPAGVTLRGLGPSRTTLHADADTGIDTDRGGSDVDGARPRSIVPPGPIVRLGDGARLEHLTVGGAPVHARRIARVLVEAAGPGSTVLGCTVAGTIEVSADDVVVRAVSACAVVAIGSDRLHVSHCSLSGTRADIGVDVRGGGGHLIDSNELEGHLCAIRVAATTGSTVRGNSVTSGRRWGIHVDHAEDAHVHGNRITSTMRAVHVDGGRHTVVDGNAVTGGDSGCIVADGAVDCEVYGNHWQRCRVGLLSWGATGLHHQDNVASDLHGDDGALVTD